MGVAHRDAALAEALTHGVCGDVHTVGDPGQRPPLMVEPNGLADLIIR